MSGGLFCFYFYCFALIFSFCAAVLLQLHNQTMLSTAQQYLPQFYPVASPTISYPANVRPTAEQSGDVVDESASGPPLCLLSLYHSTGLPTACYLILASHSSRFANACAAAATSLSFLLRPVPRPNSILPA